MCVWHTWATYFVSCGDQTEWNQIVSLKGSISLNWIKEKNVGTCPALRLQCIKQFQGDNKMSPTLPPWDNVCTMVDKRTGKCLFMGLSFCLAWLLILTFAMRTESSSGTTKRYHHLSSWAGASDLANLQGTEGMFCFENANGETCMITAMN